MKISAISNTTSSITALEQSNILCLPPGLREDLPRIQEEFPPRESTYLDVLHEFRSQIRFGTTPSSPQGDARNSTGYPDFSTGLPRQSLGLTPLLIRTVSWPRTPRTPQQRINSEYCRRIK